MGKLTTEGNASGHFDCDTIIFTISFVDEGKNQKQVMDNAEQSCNKFLEELLEINIKPEEVTFEDKGLSNRYREKELVFEAQKKLEIRLEADNTSYRCVYELLKNHEEDITYSISYELVNDEEIIGNLLKEAIQEAQKRAMVMASTIDKKIVGIDFISDNSYITRSRKQSANISREQIEAPQFLASRMSLVDRTSQPKEQRSKKVEVTWILSE